MPSRCVFVDLPEASFRRLPAMFADALPDDFGNALIDAWMAGMGALEFKPARTPAISGTTAINLSRLVESARQAVHGEFGSALWVLGLDKTLLEVAVPESDEVGLFRERRRLPVRVRLSQKQNEEPDF